MICHWVKDPEVEDSEYRVLIPGCYGAALQDQSRFMKPGEWPCTCIGENEVDSYIEDLERCVTRWAFDRRLGISGPDLAALNVAVRNMLEGDERQRWRQ